VLGGTNPHVELIRQLRTKGYYVVLVDYLPDPPCAAYADRHIKESTLDADKILEIAQALKAELVISTCIDQANSTCCYVAEKLGLPHPYDYQTSLNVTDKSLMKAIMAENGIPTSPFIVLRDISELDESRIRFPAVVKPVDCNSSKGVYRADTMEEILRYTVEDFQMSRSGKVIIEGFNKGEEIQVDCFANDRGAEVIMTRQKKSIRGESGMVLQSTGSVIPAPLSGSLDRQAREIADRIASAFGLRNTPFFYQAIVTSEGISVLEFAPRIGGGLSYYLLKELAGYDSVAAAIDSFQGRKVTPAYLPVNKCYSTCLLYANPGVFDHVEGFAELKESGVIRDHFQLKSPGARIDGDMRSSNRVCAFVVEGDTPEDVRKKERIAYNRIRILDPNGQDIMNKSLIGE
ncbi:MAG: ATP-grasp domain-containing protein, partial [Oscillospiraceae bacterium]|nr:ATP-grasp domain-containing protein [Oscillospiraceae bacterium]